MSTVAVTDESFESKVLKAEGPVLVDFWAEWCGPCKQIAPALEQIAGELAGKVAIAKLNIEESPTTPSRYGVRGIPTMMLFRGGQMASMKVGAMPKQKILEWLAATGAPAAQAQRRPSARQRDRDRLDRAGILALQLRILDVGHPGLVDPQRVPGRRDGG